MRRRRGFALIAAIGVLAVLGLIIAAFGDSVMTHRQVAQRWKERSAERLAIGWALGELQTSFSSTMPLTVEGSWGTLAVRGSLTLLDPADEVYDHPALSHRPGDALVVIEIGERVHCLLSRESPDRIHHRLPVEPPDVREETAL